MKKTTIKMTSLSLIVLATLASGCARHLPSVCKPLPLEKIQAAGTARKLSLQRLKSYQIGTTTEDDFLRDGWRHASVARPLGDIGISSVKGKVSITEQSVIYAEYDLGYQEFASGRMAKVCTLHFDEMGLLRSISWNADTIHQ